jgi:OmpA-OmpF porin, OOP family
MLKFLLSIILCFICSISVAQKVQWANKVIEYSSEFMVKQYSATQALGKPDVFPKTGESPNAWTPKSANKMEFITVGFASPQKIQQIVIAESYNPGALYQLYVYDKTGKEYLINTFSKKTVNTSGRLLNIYLPQTKYEVASIKAVFNGKFVDGFYSIDAIGISESSSTVQIKINQADNVKKELKIEKLDANINSSVEDLNPLLSPDGKTLFFSRKNHPGNAGGIEDQEDIWYSTYNEQTQKWEPAKNIGSPINNKFPNFINTISPDGDGYILLLGNEYKKTGKVADGLSISKKTKEGFSDPEPVVITNHYNMSDKANYFLAENKEVMILSIERDDSFGDRDLYVSFSQPDNKWTEPKSLGKTVNSANEESSPFLSKDLRTLYFSSKGFSGHGGLDIFRSIRLDDSWEKWTEPENMGGEINTEKDESFFTIPAIGNFAYFSRGITGKDMDIYSVELPLFIDQIEYKIVKGRVVDAKTGLPVSSEIFYRTWPEGELVARTHNEPSTGEYSVSLPVNKKYNFIAETEGFVGVSQFLDISASGATTNMNVFANTATNNTANNQIRSENSIINPTKSGEENNYFSILKMVPLKANETFVVNNILFEINKSELKSNFNPELDKIFAYMDENQEPTIYIAGHTDNLGGDIYNLRLSERRAKAVMNYFVERGISKERVKSIGFGAEYPLNDNLNEEQRQLNRRVEIKIN